MLTLPPRNIITIQNHIVMKKILLLFAVFMSVISAFADDVYIDGIYYNVRIDGVYYNLDKMEKMAEVTNNGKRDATEEVAIPEGNSYSGDIVIPSSVIYDGETYTVTRLGKRAFYKCPNLTSVEIPNSVTEVEGWMFFGCSNLHSVKLPNSLKRIGDSMFDECSSLASINIPESVEDIGEQAFRDCSSLSCISIPNSVKYIESAAFMGCTELKSVNISNSVKLIGDLAFKNCSKLTSVAIGEGMATLADQAFWGCNKLESVTVLATTPPEFEWSNEAFSYYGTLHVKKGCKEAYSNAPYWNNFNIVEDADAGIQEYTYKPMLEEGMVWNYEMRVLYSIGLSEDDFEDILVTVPYTVSVVEGPDENGIAKLYESFNTEEMGEKFKIKDRYTYMQENNKVITLTNHYGPWLDFNLKKGDRVSIPVEWTPSYCFDEYFDVVDEDFISVKGRTYRRLKIRNDYDGDVRFDYWVEGIGSKNYAFLTHAFVPHSEYTPDGVNRYFSTPRLVSISKDGECIFKPEDFDAPGSSAIEDIACDNPARVSSIYDLQGRKLTSAPEKGIYIKDGRKMVK